MQTRPKLLHYGLSWPISGAFTNPNCALAGRDCSIQTVCWEKNEKENTVHLHWEQLSVVRYLYPMCIICAHKMSCVFSLRKAHIHGDDSICFPYKCQQWPVQSALSVLSIWHKLNTLNCRTYVILKCAEWQLYFRLQTGTHRKGLLCKIYCVCLQNNLNVLCLTKWFTEVSH